MDAERQTIYIYTNMHTNIHTHISAHTFWKKISGIQASKNIVKVMLEFIGPTDSLPHMFVTHS